MKILDAIIGGIGDRMGQIGDNLMDPMGMIDNAINSNEVLALMQDPKIFKLIWQQYKKRYQRFETDPFIIATNKKRLLDLANSKDSLSSLSI